MMKLKKRICVGHVERTQEKKNKFKVLEEQPERKRPIGSNRGRWNNIKIVFKGIEWESND
jgi:hypothetical protein